MGITIEAGGSSSDSLGLTRSGAWSCSCTTAIAHRRRGARGRGPAVARARAPRRAGRAARARLRRSSARAARRARACCAAAWRPARWRARCGRPARASCTPTTCSPAFGWRALAAARAAGARVVLHLHQYRLVCAVGVCFTRGAECTRCHGRNTLPGVRLNCRGSRARGARLRRLAGAVAAAPGRAGRRRDRAERVRARAAARARRAAAVGARARARAAACARSSAALPARGRARPRPSYALVVSRLAPEKGVDVAIDACRARACRCVIAGDGPERAALARAARAGARRALRSAASTTPSWRGCARGAAIALVPSRSAETFGLAAAEAMAAGVPVAASRVGALPELLDAEALVAPGDAEALARRDRAPRRRPRGRRSADASACAPCARPRGRRGALAASTTAGDARAEHVSWARVPRRTAR